MEGCRVGVGRARLTPDSAGGTLGWGHLGRNDAVPSDDSVDELVATAIALEDARGERVVVVCCDLHCASAPVWRKAAADAEIDPARLIISATHTHEGPAQHYGGRMYTWFANARPRGARHSGDRIAKQITNAIVAAIDDLRPGGVTVRRVEIRGAASNRSFPAWRNDSAEDRHAFLDATSQASVEQPAADLASDPRATVLSVAADDGSRSGALAWFAVHGTALGARWPTFSADLWGEARTLVENVAAGGVTPTVGFGGGASGDVSPLPLDENGVVRTGETNRPVEQGRELARVVGRRIGTAVSEIVAAAEHEPFELSVAHEVWSPRSAGLPGPLLGLATAGAGIDGTTDLWPEVADGVHADLYRRRRWRNRFMGRGHRPKIGIDAAYSPVPLPLRPIFRLVAPRSFPLHALRVGTHVFATVPGEATTMAGWRIERLLLEVDGVDSASIVGFSGDYGGYWTTPEEYALQRYEGSSTLFGPDSTTALGRALQALARQAR